MRSLPRGYSLPSTLTGGDTIRFPMESMLATLWSLAYWITYPTPGLCKETQ